MIPWTYDSMVMYYGRGTLELHKYWATNNSKDSKVPSACNVPVPISLFLYNQEYRSLWGKAPS